MGSNGLATGEAQQLTLPAPVSQEAPTSTYLASIADAMITGYLVEVSPALAQEWLRCNRGNRPIRRGHVQSLANDVRGGHWKITHQGIAFARGRLIDGQHRLHAIISAGKPAYLAVYPDMTEDVFGALDRGQKRTHADDILRNPRVVEACAYIARLVHHSDKSACSTQEVADMWSIYGKDAEDVLEACGLQRIGRTVAPVRAALVLRLHQALPKHRTHLLRQYQAFVTLETAVIDTTTEALLRRLETIKAGSSGGAADERAAVAWIAWDPAQRGLQKIIVRELSRELEDMRSAVRRHRRDFEESQQGRG